MRKFKKITKEINVVEDYICDICNDSCCGDYDIAEFLELRANWGYASHWDGERWEAQVCMECVKKHLLELINFNKDPEKQWL